MTNLEVFSDLSERLNYNLPDLPLYVRKGSLHQFNNYAAVAHWHLDIEFIYILQGSMDFSVNGSITRLHQGDGLFVNSQRLHFGYSLADHKDCLFLVVVIHPSILGEKPSFIQTYWGEKFSLMMADFVVLTDQVDWQQRILLSIQEIYQEMHKDHTPPNPLRLASQALSLSATIGDHLQPISGQPGVLTHVQEMTRFIHQNYDQKITLEEIAYAGAVCRSRCCTLFNKYVGQTPNNYVTQYRLQKSCEMLKETRRSISEIALACGFQSASYFSSIFRKQMGVVPQNYRKQVSNNDST
ncbi:MULTISPECIES: AraC family transcriptional regulator [Paenibacillus]|jgi:AraC-like DNA-binding protein|uniref:AraC family transcriptional regulator n=1 Tax=Paenibacillus TaxID=44249 RepID=UPI00041FC11C|nr:MULTISPECIES: AraC family transcriptional regulator [Paenibacillus]KEO80210.1 AraC family transcriptional regulator [Paenibacillus polymyxa]MCH6186319.1 AraC family transcriptional regulator [Paenibacillus polymyxa]UMY56093.1 AraC family transcriptional regulator [Paenibacillus peoriae]WRL60684.1 AraC family transcriptional regulator [Paenibacillus polymyxa]